MSLTKSVSLIRQIHSTKLFYMCVCIIWYMLYDTYYFYYMFIFCILYETVKYLLSWNIWIKV